VEQVYKNQIKGLKEQNEKFQFFCWYISWKHEKFLKGFIGPVKTWNFTYLLLTSDRVRWERRPSRAFSDVPKWRLTRSVLVLDKCTLYSLLPRQYICKINIISVENYRYIITHTVYPALTIGTHTDLINISHNTPYYYPLLLCEFIIYL